MSPRRSRARRDDGLSRLQARIESVAAQTRCRRLLHLVLPGADRPAAIPGCAACVEMVRLWDEAPKLPRPTATTHDGGEGDWRAKQ